MIEKTLRTFWVRIFLSGPIEVAKQVCRRECWREGLCVTIEPTTYVYTGGEEQGYVVGLLNYPRYLNDPDFIMARARKLALELMAETCQASVLLVTPHETIWLASEKKGA